jgi:hypothetical protein
MRIKQTTYLEQISEVECMQNEAVKIMNRQDTWFNVKNIIAVNYSMRNKYKEINGHIYIFYISTFIIY